MEEKHEEATEEAKYPCDDCVGSKKLYTLDMIELCDSCDCNLCKRCATKCTGCENVVCVDDKYFKSCDFYRLKPLCQACFEYHEDENCKLCEEA